MEKTQHTHGPWTYRAQTQGQFIIESTERSICWLDRHYDPTKANARLISAAPDMLDALQAVCDAYGDRDTLLMAQVKAALAKAKGGAK
jgi:hypothetical protein